jgi:molecular chaperone HscB
MKGVEGRVDQPARCMNCKEPLESPIGCLHCHSIFPDERSLSHFDRLGLPARFELSREDVDRKYLAWSRELHPDFHATRGVADQHISLRLSAALNDAYSTLRDPFRRAEYLLHLLGGPTATEHREMPAGFLESILELRMEIEEAKEAGGDDRSQIEALADRIDRERRSGMEEVARLFREVESRGQAASQDDLSAIREQLNTIKYRDGLLRELRIA